MSFRVASVDGDTLGSQPGEGGSIPTATLQFRKAAYRVQPVALKVAQEMVARLHYARGGSNTACYTHGLIEVGTGRCVGVAWWLPPTRVACESVDRANWKKVLSLTRLVIEPGVPTNACSFLLAHSVRLIRQDARFGALVTYADESQGHLGTIYRAAGWEYVGRTGPYPRWVNAEGKQVACKATKNRNKAQMEALGHTKTGSFYKHKFVLKS